MNEKDNSVNHEESQSKLSWNRRNDNISIFKLPGISLICVKFKKIYLWWKIMEYV